MRNPQRASVRAKTRTYGTDLPSRQKSCALSITPLHHLQKKMAQCLNQSDWLPFGEQKGGRICTMGLVCQVYVETSSDDSRVD